MSLHEKLVQDRVGRFRDLVGLRRRSRASRLLHDPAVTHFAFACLAVLTDVMVIVSSAVAIGGVYHTTVYQGGSPEIYVRLGFLVALLFVAPGILHSDYAVSRFFTLKGQLRRASSLWVMAFLTTVLIGFLTKTGASLSRGTMLVFFVAGFGALSAGRYLLVGFAQRSAAHGDVNTRRIFLLGREEEIEAFNQRYRPWMLGMRVVSACVLRGPDFLKDDLALAAASARLLRPDDIYILEPWSDTQTIEACIDAFLRVPAALHLGAERVLDRFVQGQIERVGPVVSLRLVRRPLSAIEVIAKRCFDMVLAGIGLVLLSPLFALVALAIKFDSHGPVFFLQRRYGFNQHPFRIVKFRSMTTMDDGRHIVQAQAGDARITRVGRLLRKYNIDELPQLINVLIGDMSLVGPRPHALAHDQQYESRIDLYARRHNVKPGITGWAQVNGLRGDTSTPDKMRRRVEHDLYYIDNWSLGFDVRILVLTVFSRRAYENAV